MSFLELENKWEYKHIQDLTKGIRADIPSITLDPGEALTAHNVKFYKRTVRSDTGYAPFLSTVRGNPRVSYQFYMKDGSSELMLITDATLYKLESAEWRYVSDGTATTTSNDEVAGQTVIEVPSTAGFTASDYVGIDLSDGTQHRTTIASVSAGVSITIDDAIPTGKNTGVGAAVVKAVDLTGSADIQVSVCTLPSHDWFVFTNGVDNPQYYDGASCQTLPNLPSSGNTQCRLVTVFENHLILAHTTEGGSKYPQRVRRSDTGDPTNWTTGNAGFTDLFDNEDWLIAVSALGPYMIFYRERSVVRTEYVGTVDLLFDFETVIAGEGALSQDSVIDLGDYHLFVGNSNIYEYRGGFDFNPIGDKIYDLTFGVNGELNASYKQRVFGFYVEELDEVWIFYPTTTDEYPTKLMRLALANNAFYTRDFGLNLTGFGFYQSQDDKTWNELVGDWTQQDWSWDSKSVSANSPITHLLSDDGQVYEYDYFTTNDNGNTIDYVFETEDFGHPRFMIRTDTFDFRIQGSSILVEISFDEGDNWQTLTTITKTTLGLVSTSLQKASRRFRLRLSGSSGLIWESLGFIYRMESEY